MQQAMTSRQRCKSLQWKLFTWNVQPPKHQDSFPKSPPPPNDAISVQFSCALFDVSCTSIYIYNHTIYIIRVKLKVSCYTLIPIVSCQSMCVCKNGKSGQVYSMRSWRGKLHGENRWELLPTCCWTNACIGSGLCKSIKVSWNRNQVPMYISSTVTMPVQTCNWFHHWNHSSSKWEIRRRIKLTQHSQEPCEICCAPASQTYFPCDPSVPPLHHRTPQQISQISQCPAIAFNTTFESSCSPNIIEYLRASQFIHSANNSTGKHEMEDTGYSFRLFGYPLLPRRIVFVQACWRQNLYI